MLTVDIFHGFADINITELVPCIFSSSIPTSMSLKDLSGHMHMYKLKNAITPEQMSYHKSFLWDTIHFEWYSMCLHMNGQPVNPPSSITIPVRDKIRAKQMLAKKISIYSLGSNKALIVIASADSVSH